jgi:hypothetical protein
MRRITRQITLIRRATGEAVEAADVDGVAEVAAPDTDVGTANIKGQVGRLARRLQSKNFWKSVTLKKRLKKTERAANSL